MFREERRAERGVDSFEQFLQLPAKPQWSGWACASYPRHGATQISIEYIARPLRIPINIKSSTMRVPLAMFYRGFAGALLADIDVIGSAQTDAPLAPLVQNNHRTRAPSRDSVGR
jgi:hypothetical protein